MIKLIASDLDGTLMKREENALSSKVEGKIKTVLNKGKVFAVISGRDYASLRKVFASVEDKIYFVCCGGSLCIKNGKPLYSRPVSRDNVTSAVRIAQVEGENLVLSGQSCVYVIGSDNFKERITEMYGFDAIPITQINEVREEIYKISFFSKNNDLGFDTTPFGLKVFYHKNGWCEYINRFAGKGEALSDMQCRLGVTKAETAALGDEESDIGMLMKAGKAFAAKPEIAQRAGAQHFEQPEKVLKELIDE